MLLPVRFTVSIPKGEESMIYERDREFPFQKILVKEGRETVGIIRRNLKTGDYQYYDTRPDSLTPLFRAARLDYLKLWVEATMLSA